MNLVAHIRNLGIVPAEDAPAQRSLDDLARKFPEPRKLARELIQRNLLTPYQANQLLTGKGDSLLLGPHLILDRLGEGGMGKVYKARHQKLGRVVAIKVIHPARVTNPVAVKRFYREIEAVAKLSHPNIVWAFDAGQVGSIHYFAMQYIPGIDLSRMVKEHGPLDVVRACDYIRQAALGLQHIAEHGMVHRDIKPSNLLIIDAADRQAKAESGALATATKTDLVKIMDLGLTRLEDDCDEDRVNTLTQQNTMMGTPDYVAPEQARNSHLADIRSDIYSLGCSLYFALIGRPPFSGKSAVEKIMKHQMEQPPLLDALRPGLPTSLNVIVQRMMAKNPEQRFQLPVEVAQVLEPFTRGQFAPAAIPVGPGTVPGTEDLKQTQSLFQFGETEIQPMVRPSTTSPRQPAGPFEKWLGLWIAGGATLLLIVLLLLLKIFLR
jgi:eukaryotic-like serine/threonine-protein kinase